MGLIQSVIERSGIPTVSLSTLEQVSRKVRPPRVAVRDVEMGYPLGEPGDVDGQCAMILKCLRFARQPIDAPRFEPIDALP